MPRSRVEQETVIVWNQAEPELTLWTASPVVARRLRKRGWPLAPDGECWKGTIPIGALSFRTLAADGKPKRRTAAGNPQFKLQGHQPTGVEAR